MGVMDIFSNLGIRTKLIVIFVVLLPIPVAVVGYMSYSLAAGATYDQVEDKLATQAEDWMRIADSYVIETAHVRDREDKLIQNQLKLQSEDWRLAIHNEMTQARILASKEKEMARNHIAAISLDVKKMMELAVEQHGRNTPYAEKERVYDKVADIEIGSLGYVYIIGCTNGVNRGHYIVSKDRLRDGEDIWNAKDSQGRLFIQEMVEEGEKLSGDDIYFIEYPWRNIGETKDRMKVAAIAYFEPWDVIIGASSYYDDFASDVEEDIKEHLKEEIAEVEIGETGYIWVLNSSGHYIVSKDRLRDGEYLWDAKDADGNYFIRDLVNGGKETPTEAYFLTYPWQNVGETEAIPKIAAVTYVPEWDWVIGASAYYKDFRSTLEEDMKERLKDKMAEEKIGETGYIWVLNSSGHYIVSSQRARDGENIWDVEDDDGNRGKENTRERTRQHRVLPVDKRGTR